jgi:hypothetical protein
LCIAAVGGGAAPKSQYGFPRVSIAQAYMDNAGHGFSQFLLCFALGAASPPTAAMHKWAEAAHFRITKKQGDLAEWWRDKEMLRLANSIWPNVSTSVHTMILPPACFHSTGGLD